MDRKEAISRIEDYIGTLSIENHHIIKWTSIFGEDPVIEKIIVALKVAVEALNRLTPKEPIYFKSCHEWRCHGCHCILKSASKHCPTCGQAIDWMEVYKKAGKKNNETVGN